MRRVLHLSGEEVTGSTEESFEMFHDYSIQFYRQTAEKLRFLKFYDGLYLWRDGILKGYFS